MRKQWMAQKTSPRSGAASRAQWPKRPSGPDRHARDGLADEAQRGGRHEHLEAWGACWASCTGRRLTGEVCRRQGGKSGRSGGVPVAAVHWSSSAVGGGYCSTRKKEEVSCVAKMRMERPGRWSSLVKADGGGVSAKIPARWMVSDGETRTGGHRVRGVGWLHTRSIWGGGSVEDGLAVQWWQCLFMGAENIMEKGRGGGSARGHTTEGRGMRSGPRLAGGRQPATMVNSHARITSTSSLGALDVSLAKCCAKSMGRGC
jgi:hypothetical protein